MQKIKQQLLRSSALVSSLAMAALLVMVVTNAMVHRQSYNITEQQLPFTLKINQLGEDITESLSHLNHWVMVQNPNSKAKRQALWQEHIFPGLEQIRHDLKKEEFTQNGGQLDSLHSMVKQLYISQWWVEDVSNYIGNQPALVIYQRDLLPIYSQIQSSLNGIQPVNNDLDNSHHFDTTELQILVSNAHLMLSETMHQLSQVILTGETAHINRFREKTKQVSEQLEALSEQKIIAPDAQKLIVWINRKYRQYIDLANHITQIRQASDWNIGLWIADNETEKLTERIKAELATLQKKHIMQLQQQSNHFEKLSFAALLVAVLFFILSILWAYIFAHSQANKMTNKIEHLREAANNIAFGRQDLLEINYNDELDDLANVFNSMQTTILRRRQKFIRERERLNEIIRVISHDIKAPLINIKGHADAICEDIQEQTELPEELQLNLQDSIAHISTASSRIDELISGILTFSEYMYFKVNLEKLDFTQVIEDIFSFNAHRMENVTVERQLIRESLYSDLFVVKFIISTLLDNALKYRHAKRPLILQLELSVNKDTELCYFSITDNGLGISTLKEDQVFKLFTKGEHQPGNGIGLCCARSMAEKLAGDISFHHNPDDRGVTFVFQWQYFTQESAARFENIS